MPKHPQPFAPAIRRTLSFSALVLVASAAFAAAPPYGVGDALKGATPPTDETKKQPTTPETPAIVQEGEPAFDLAEGKRLFIKDFAFEGADAKDAAKLSALLAPYKNKELSMKDIHQAANRVTVYYRNQGLVVAKTIVPKQDASQGTLTLHIVKGRYGQVTLTNRSLVKDSILQGVFEDIKGGNATVTQAGLERGVLLIKEMPGSSMPTVTIAPGTAPGTSDFGVKVDPSPRFNGYLMGDNQGSRYTGKDRVYGGIDLNSPFGIADKLSLSGMTTHGHDLYSYRAAYGAPLAGNGLRGELAASHALYTLGGEYSALGAEGKADVIEGTVSYPLKKSRSESIDLSLNIAYKKLKDDQTAVGNRNPRKDVIGTFTAQRNAYGSLWGHNAFTSASLALSYGKVTITDSAAQVLNQAGADSEGSFSKLNLSLAGNLDLTQKLSVKGSLKAQQILTPNNVDSSEQFFISGSSGVKVFSETYGFDNGYLANAELQYALPPLGGISHSVGAFFDTGHAVAQKGSYALVHSYDLSDGGLGYYVNYKKFFCALQGARSMWKSSTIANPGTRFLVQAGVSF